MTQATFREMALALPGTEEAPHFDRAAFKVKRIYATYQASTHSANLKLSPAEQATFSDFGDAIFKLPNKWGEQGWTTFLLDQVPESLMQEALLSAYQDALPRRK